MKSHVFVPTTKLCSTREPNRQSATSFLKAPGEIIRVGKPRGCPTISDLTALSLFRGCTSACTRAKR